MINQIGIIKKGWGFESILHSTDNFCVKYLNFKHPGSKCSLHSHNTKYEEWTVTRGAFILSIGSNNRIIERGEVIKVLPGVQHRLAAIKRDSQILEVSTADHMEDNIRHAPGDSQTKGNNEPPNL